MLVLFIVLNVIVSLVSSQSSTVMPSSSTPSSSNNKAIGVVTNAIQAISELSRVCIVVSRRDYRLDTSQSYTYINYPSSYRTTLTQASDVVDGAFRTAEQSMSRVNMIMGAVPQQMNIIEDVLTQGAPEDVKIFLPSTLQSISKMFTDATSAFEQISTGFNKVIAFFEELLRAVQPSPPPSTTANPSVSTTTQANKSPLDIDHAVAISNILTYFKSLTATWNRMKELSSQNAAEAGRALQFTNDRNALLDTLGGIDDAADLFKRIADLYTQLSMKIFTPRTITMSSYLMLEDEATRLTEVTTVNAREDNNLANVPKSFAQLKENHVAHSTERNERYNRLFGSTSSTTPSSRISF